MSTQTDDSKPASKKRKAGEVSLSDQIPPSGSSSTRSIKQYVFIDKTNMLRRIMAHKEPYIFAPCMRRCGKSTAVTLLKAMAENDRDTLDGMDVCTSDPNSWNLPETAEYYGVVYLDFSQIPQAKVGDPIATIEAAIASFLRERAAEVNITIPNAMKSAKQVLRNWIVQLSRCSKPERKNSVVVLIDEYDAILNPFLNDPDMLETVSTALKEVFVCLKGADEFIFKAFVTGGLKAGMSGLFSGGNNFHRILDREAQYTSLFGFTKQEIEETYGDHIKEIFQETTLQESLDVMASYYNGYRFHPKQKGTLFNPFSTICYLGGKELDEYWAGTCTSALLKNIMLRHGSDALRGCRISWKALQSPLGKNGMEDSWKSVLFQSGYFSIWDVDEDDLLLGPPNIEVTEYMKAEIARVLQLEASKIGALSLVTQYSNSLRNFDFEKAATDLTSVISKLKYSLVNENEVSLRCTKQT